MGNNLLHTDMKVLQQVVVSGNLCRGFQTQLTTNASVGDKSCIVLRSQGLPFVRVVFGGTNMWNTRITRREWTGPLRSSGGLYLWEVYGWLQSGSSSDKTRTVRVRTTQVRNDVWHDKTRKRRRIYVKIHLLVLVKDPTFPEENLPSPPTMTTVYDSFVHKYTHVRTCESL